MDLKDIIYVSQADFNTLANGGTITKDGQTYSYDDGNVYAVEYTEPTVPTKTSDLTNDSGFITSSDIPSIPTKTSDLTNDSGFLTLGTLPIWNGGVE